MNYKIPQLLKSYKGFRERETRLLRGAFFHCRGLRQDPLELLVEFAGRAGDEYSAGDVALAVLHALHDARRLTALWTIRRFRGVHDLLTICCLCDLCH
jgi:hypothetical protein